MRTVRVRADRVRGLARLLLAGALLVPMVACSAEPTLTTQARSQPTAAPVPISAPQRGPADPVPVPAGPTVLTLAGRIAQTNGSGVLRLDPATLDQLGVVEVTVYEPWVKQEMQFQGTWLGDVLAVAGPASGAQGVHLTALDSYQIDLSMADIEAGGILLATKTGDGRPIPIEEGGPLRIVFVGGVPSGDSADQWIWSVSMIDVR
jgi:hypothetical protein